MSLASNVTDCLCGLTPMITRSTLATSSLTLLPNTGEDGHRYFEQSRPFLSHASPRHLARTHAMKEPRLITQAGSRKESARPGTSPEPALARAV